jgi:DedD protein
MIRDFSKEELEPAANDTEFTLGAGAFLGIGGGLLLLCAVCFGLGYVVGHRSAPEQAAAGVLSEQNTKPAVMPVGSGAKPGAATQAAVQQPQVQTPESMTADENGAGGVRAMSAVGSSQGADAQVNPALALQTQQPRSQVPAWMVQIAAVSHAEDAQVLVDALRKRGYEVAARRDANDNLIHVQTGPFVNRNDANAIRQKLLNDGYNAIVQ